ncbi:MAG: D-2-hydroxyacid dehydrogenase [Chloroflexota bacterium]
MNLPSKKDLTICFAHPAYQLSAVFAERETGINHFQVWNRESVAERLPEADVLVTSGFWNNGLFKAAPNLRFVQSVSAGIDQYDQALFRARGARLASAAGVNANAVAQHALALILSFARLLHTGRDNQHRQLYRGMISDPAQREDELGGKTILIVGLGRIGRRLAQLAKAFEMHVIATKRTPERDTGVADAVYPPSELPNLLPQADYVVLTCPLTPATENLIDAQALAAMRPDAYLINVARGRVVNEPALIASLQAGQLAGAGLDCTWEEPLPSSSPLWAMENVIITPHSAGETRQYEAKVIDILLENLERLWRGETQLVNEVV